MHILVTNDDGVNATGLLALAQALRPLGKVSVVAPDHNWSVTGHVKTLHRPLRVRPVELADGSPALTTDGSPSDCVAMVALGLLDEPVDFVVSGINSYANLGHDLTYSGTVTAAMEGAIWKIPSIAVSLNGSGPDPDQFNYVPAANVGRRVVEQVLARGLPPYVVLNVNVPNLPEPQLGPVCITRQGLRIYRDALSKRVDPSGRPYYWLGGEPPSGVIEAGTDFGALNDGCISITPVQLDLTAFELMATLHEWKW